MNPFIVVYIVGFIICLGIIIYSAIWQEDEDLLYANILLATGIFVLSPASVPIVTVIGVLSGIAWLITKLIKWIR